VFPDFIVELLHEKDLGVLFLGLFLCSNGEKINEETRNKNNLYDKI